MGVAEIYDAAPGTRYVCVPETASVSTISFGADLGTGNLWGASPALTLAIGDQIRLLVRYRWR
jgi:hypothetical protein